MSEQPQSAVTSTVFAPHPKYGKYVSHHPSRRFTLIFRGGVVYALGSALVQAIFWNVPNNIAAIFVPVLFALMAGAILWYVLHLWNREVILYETGFTYREGSRVGQFSYDEIVQVRQNIERVQLFGVIPRITYDYRMRSRDDEILRITNLYSDTNKLINYLDTYISREQSALVRQQLENGMFVRFGDAFKLSREGVEHDGRDIFWHEISGYQVKGGQLILSTADNPAWAQVDVTEIDNVVVLIGILKRRTVSEASQN